MLFSVHGMKGKPVKIATLKKKKYNDDSFLFVIWLSQTISNDGDTKEVMVVFL